MKRSAETPASGEKAAAGTPFAPRVRNLCRGLRRRGAAALLVTDPSNLRYLTGFGDESSWALVIARSGRVYLVSDPRFEEEIPHKAPDAVAVIRKPGVTLVDEVARLVRRHRLAKVAVEPASLTVAQRQTLGKEIGFKRLTPSPVDLAESRQIKDDMELSWLRRAVEIQEKAFLRTLEWLRPGTSEGEVAGFLEMQMRALGSEGASFPTIVAAGSSSSKPHYNPGSQRVRKGQVLLVDWGATYQGYHSDMTRVVALGKMPRLMRKIYAIVLAAHTAALEAMAPGRALADVDRAARRVIEDAGYGPQFSHSLGHGIGIDIHESPALTKTSRGTLAPGHVVTVEPGIYLPGVGGVRIEDDVLVTAGGIEVLSRLPRSLEAAVVEP